MKLLLNHNEEYSKIEDIPEFEGFTIILFDFLDTPGYYRKKYINDCQNSWLRVLKNVRFLTILVNDEVMNLSKWSQRCNGNHKFISDSLRVYFVNQFNNAIYLDTDVYLTSQFDITPLVFNNDCFIIDNCTGTFLYNKKKNNEVLEDFWNFYNEVLSLEDSFYDNGDLIAYEKFTKYRAEKGLMTINSIKIPKSIVHFSCFYPWIRDKERIVLILEKWARETTAYKKNLKSFPLESFWPLIHYLDDKEIYPDLVFFLQDTDKAITFYF